jgi:hypothetical protein
MLQRSLHSRTQWPHNHGPTVERAQHTTVGWAARTCGSHAMSFGQPDSVLLYSVPLAWPQERYPETAVRKLGLSQPMNED